MRYFFQSSFQTKSLKLHCSEMLNMILGILIQGRLRLFQVKYRFVYAYEVLIWHLREWPRICRNLNSAIKIFNAIHIKTIKDTVIVHINTITYTNTHPVNCKIYSIHLNKYVFHCSNLHVIKASLAFYENILYDSLIMEILCFGTLKLCSTWNRW